MWIQLANVKPGKKEQFLELRKRLLGKLANSPVITAWYTFDMDVGRGVGPLADQGWTNDVASCSAMTLDESSQKFADSRRLRCQAGHGRLPKTKE